MVDKPVVVIAIGGNAIINEKQKGFLEEQLANIEVCCDSIIELIELGNQVVLTHGNGPQVGNTLLRVESAAPMVPPMPLDVCGAETQGQMGYLIQRTLANKFQEKGLNNEIVTLVTQVVVDKNDPAFENPTKFIGPFYSKDKVEAFPDDKRIIFREDSGRGYRRVVPSPKPIRIVEKKTIKELVKKGKVVIAAGGGGIPVIAETNGKYTGVEAVIDKDLASAVLAKEIGADYLIILTGVEKVAINFGKPNMTFLSKLSLSAARQFMEEGHFPPGSMGPKIEAAIEFVEGSGGKAIITTLEKAKAAILGITGTVIFSERNITGEKIEGKECS